VGVTALLSLIFFGVLAAGQVFTFGSELGFCGLARASSTG
jgi:hypothetical protein